MHRAGQRNRLTRLTTLLGAVINRTTPPDEYDPDSIPSMLRDGQFYFIFKSYPISSYIKQLEAVKLCRVSSVTSHSIVDRLIRRYNTQTNLIPYGYSTLRNSILLLVSCFSSS